MIQRVKVATELIEQEPSDSLQLSVLLGKTDASIAGIDARFPNSVRDDGKIEISVEDISDPMRFKISVTGNGLVLDYKPNVVQGAAFQSQALIDRPWFRAVYSATGVIRLVQAPVRSGIRTGTYSGMDVSMTHGNVT